MNQSEDALEIGRLTSPDTPVRSIKIHDLCRARKLLNQIPEGVDKAKLEMRLRWQVFRFVKERYLQWCHETARLAPENVPVKAGQQWWKNQRTCWESKLSMKLPILTLPASTG